MLHKLGKITYFYATLLHEFYHSISMWMVDEVEILVAKPDSGFVRGKREIKWRWIWAALGPIVWPPVFTWLLWPVLQSGVIIFWGWFNLLNILMWGFSDLPRIIKLIKGNFKDLK